MSGGRVDQANLPDTLKGHNDRIRFLEASPGGACGPVYTVGTPAETAGQIDSNGNSVPDLIAANPPPYNASPWIFFENGFNNALGPYPPVQFWKDGGCGVWIRGAPLGGAVGDVVFTFPPGFLPEYQVGPFVQATETITIFSNWLITEAGGLTYLGLS